MAESASTLNLRVLNGKAAAVAGGVGWTPRPRAADTDEVISDPVLTLLFVPGDRPDRFAKAVAAGPDVVIVDLEDAVAPASKVRAREAAVAFLDECVDVRVQVRINALGTPWAADDIAALAALGRPVEVLVPKVRSAGDVQEVARSVAGATVHGLIEDAVGLENLSAIASAGVATLVLGEADLRSDLGLGPGDEGLGWARGRLVVAARAAGLPPPAMSVYVDINDAAGLAASTRAGRLLGYVGRLALHPSQIPVIEEAFAPTADEVAAARATMDGVAEAADAGSGVVVLADGRFADRAMLDAAHRVLALSERVSRRRRPG